jgi:dTDP-4-amino-4,6-dideoxygalactose transaminase
MAASIGSKRASIPFALPSLDSREEEAVLEVLRSGWLTTGKETLAFEKSFARKVGAKHALAVNSATAGLHLSLEALGVVPGDRVLTSPFTFTASAEIIRYLGADPVFADIDPVSLNIDPLKAAEVLKGEQLIKGIIPVHLGGLMAEMEQISKVADKADTQDFFIVEDAAHSFPVTDRSGKSAGTIGKTGVFSFYATKTITTGEGGMVVTDDDQVAERISLMRLHGIDRDVWNRYRDSRGSWEYEVVAPGYKYNLTDIASAIGRVQLEKAEAFKKRRREIAAYYLERFKNLEQLILPYPGAEGEDHAWHLFILRVRSSRSGKPQEPDRDTIIDKLSQRGVGSSVHYRALHLMPYYRDRYGLKPEDFPEASRASENCFSIPIYPGLSDGNVEYISDSILDIVRKG